MNEKKDNEEMLIKHDDGQKIDDDYAFMGKTVAEGIYIMKIVNIFHHDNSILLNMGITGLKTSFDDKLDMILDHAYLLGRESILNEPKLSKKEKAQIHADLRKKCRQKLAIILTTQDISKKTFIVNFVKSNEPKDILSRKISNQTSGNCNPEEWFVEALDRGMEAIGMKEDDLPKGDTSE